VIKIAKAPEDFQTEFLTYNDRPGNEINVSTDADENSKKHLKHGVVILGFLT